MTIKPCNSIPDHLIDPVDLADHAEQRSRQHHVINLPGEVEAWEKENRVPTRKGYLGMKKPMRRMRKP
jgi:hypothetical protein